jgi:hypothetical protein
MFIFFLIHVVKLIKLTLTKSRMQDHLGQREYYTTFFS